MIEPTNTPVTTYSVLVGSLWVVMDFAAKAVSITRTSTTPLTQATTPLPTTEDLGDGVLVDRNAAGHIFHVEVLG